MNKLYLFFLLLCLGYFTNAQIVINEIMYNPPESGTDYLEYIEFYNSGNTPVHLKNYSIKDAVIFTFPDTTLAAFSYMVICVDAQKFDSVFGYKALEWSSGGLRNTDEVITLLDSVQNPVDSVHYYSSWNNLTNGNGASLELCRPTADNNQEIFWRPSTKATSIIINNKEIFATPTKVNSVICAEHNVLVQDFKFSPDTLEIFVGEQVEWKNLSGTHNVNGDKSIFPLNPVSFGNGALSSAKWSYIHRFDVVGLYQYQCDLHGSSGMKGIIIVKNKDINYPDLPIGLVSSTDINGEVDSLNKRCSIEGTVYGINLRPLGLQFTLIDRFNDGIAVFLSSGNLNYTVKEGDLLRIKGIINQFNGLVQIIPDSIIKLAIDHPLFNPTLVTFLNESTESQLVQLKNMSLVDPNTWTNNPLGFTVKITNGSNVFDMRIDNDVNIHGTPAPIGKFDITGLGSQFDGVSPFLEGYQIMPRYLADIKVLVETSKVGQKNTEIYPNPIISEQIQIRTDEKFSSFEIWSARGNLLSNGHFRERISFPFNAGLYFLKLKGNSSIVIRLVKI